MGLTGVMMRREFPKDTVTELLWTKDPGQEKKTLEIIPGLKYVDNLWQK